MTDLRCPVANCDATDIPDYCADLGDHLWLDHKPEDVCATVVALLRRLDGVRVWAGATQQGAAAAEVLALLGQSR
jgi:hypothetical protein